MSSMNRKLVTLNPFNIYCIRYMYYCAYDNYNHGLNILRQKQADIWLEFSPPSISMLQRKKLGLGCQKVTSTLLQIKISPQQCQNHFIITSVSLQQFWTKKYESSFKLQKKYVRNKPDIIFFRWLSTRCSTKMILVEKIFKFFVKEHFKEKRFWKIWLSAVTYDQQCLTWQFKRHVKKHNFLRTTIFIFKVKISNFLSSCSFISKRNIIMIFWQKCFGSFQ